LAIGGDGADDEVDLLLFEQVRHRGDRALVGALDVAEQQLDLVSGDRAAERLRCHLHAALALRTVRDELAAELERHADADDLLRTCHPCGQRERTQCPRDHMSDYLHAGFLLLSAALRIADARRPPLVSVFKPIESDGSSSRMPLAVPPGGTKPVSWHAMLATVLDEKRLVQ